MKGLSETAFASQVEDLLDMFGWKWMHIRPSIMQSGKWASSMNKGGKGWLDYLALRPPNRILVAELKDDYSKRTPEQIEWWTAWEFYPVELYLWRPKDIEEVMKILEGG